MSWSRPAMWVIDAGELYDSPFTDVAPKGPDELFPRGLTLLDLKDTGVDQLSLSNVAARQELRDLMSGLRFPSLAVGF